MNIILNSRASLLDRLQLDSNGAAIIFSPTALHTVGNGSTLVDQWINNSSRFFDSASTILPSAPLIVDCISECPYDQFILSVLDRYPSAFLFDGSAKSVHPRHVTVKTFLEAIFWWDFPNINFFSRHSYFLCLNRVPKYHKIDAVNRIYRSGLHKFGIISLGADEENLIGDAWLDQVDSDIRHLMPLSIGPLSARTQHNITEIMHTALIQLVNETSTNFKDSFTWDRVFLTEKTVKPIALRQFAIYNTTPGHVAYLRELGIDVFDDFIDHSYDKVDDYDARLSLVIAELVRLCHMPIHIIQEFATANQHRFANNICVCKEQFNTDKEKLRLLLASITK